MSRRARPAARVPVREPAPAAAGGRGLPPPAAPGGSRDRWHNPGRPFRGRRTDNGSTGVRPPGLRGPRLLRGPVAAGLVLRPSGDLT